MEFARISLLTIIALSTLMQGCEKRTEGEKPSTHASEEFRNYWHAGKAELNSFDLIQSRYGESRAGKAVMIFVTEDLSKKLQVKLDNSSGRNKTNVLKLNYTKNFITGIYPYSMMLSVFTPVVRLKDPASIKVSMSSQEWCGQVYTQMNLRGNRYVVKSHSYFEQEADESFSIRQSLLEDELWNMIRLDHANLPVGELNVIPGLFFTRLNHVDLKVLSAEAKKSESASAYHYSITFPKIQRTLLIHFEKSFPHKILGWKETWIEKGINYQTTATLDKTLFTDYWTKNKNQFQYLRDSLNLPTPY